MVSSKEKLRKTRKQKKEALTKGRHNLKDKKVRAELVQRLKKADEAHMEAVREQAALQGIELQGNKPNGGNYRLIDFDEKGAPIYEDTMNVDAAITTAADRVRFSPTFNNADGAGVIIGHWEIGTARLTHRELSGKVTIWDSSSNTTNHATHVAGTLVSRGINSNTLGMAPGATIAAFSSSGADAEMMANGAAGPTDTDLYLSNHSYGSTRGWRYDDGDDIWEWRGEYSPGGNQADFYDEDFGRYNSRSETWDNISYNLPYYLIFKSAGNSRENSPSSGDPWIYRDNFSTVTVPFYDSSVHPLSNRFYKGDSKGYDTMEGGGIAKNAIAVGSSDEGIDDNGNRDPGFATASSFSSRGPADDGRIKPDLHANGTGLTSSIASSDTATADFTGTSMSSPNACGSAALLIDYYGTRFPGQAMRASTLKGLILHTADDRGKAGPDYKYGWGVMNTEAAADVIKLHADGNGGGDLIESTLDDGRFTSETHTFDWDGSSPLRVTLCWTDPPSDEIEGHDNRTKALVNDLNLRVAGPNGTHLPYVMPYVGNWSNSRFETTATTGINTVDPIEQVYLKAEDVVAGTYSITVDYAGSLTNDEQVYSLVVSGTTIDAPTIEVNTATFDVESPPSFSTDDLAQTEYLSSSATGGNQSSEHAQLFNGTIGNTDSDRDDSGEVQLSNANTVTVNFDTSLHAAGYDLTGIETVFGWNTGANGRSNQGYEVTLTYVDNSTATLAGPTHWEPNSPAEFWTKVSFADDEGGVLQSGQINHNGSISSGTGAIASGVKAVTFNITNNANAGSWIIAREFDVFGYPTGGPYTALESWRLTHFGTTEGTGDYADNADLDKDGNVNLLEFATATDPNVSNNVPMDFSNNVDAFELNYDRNIDAMADYLFQVEWNSDLENPAGWSSFGVSEQIFGDNGSIQEVKATAPKDNEAKRFFRLKVTPK